MRKRCFALRIVIPVLNEGEALTERLASLQPLRSQGVELVVVDGGSTDESWARARPWVDKLIASPAGRAWQMNAGAQDTPSSQADALLFLHADTLLPKNALALILAALRDRVWGRFDVQLDSDDWRLKFVQTMMNLRSRFSGIATGDQAIFVRADAFRAAAGFPNQPLMEDIELSVRLKRFSGPACLRERVRTSARKWQREGVWRTIFMMWRLRLAYFFGASPHQLAQEYGYRPATEVAQASVAVFAKAPVPGLAKTRLIPSLGVTPQIGAVRAARLQRDFIGHSVHTAIQSGSRQVTLWCAPDASHRRFRSVARHTHITCQAQPEGDLGHRMQTCAKQHFSQKDALPLLIMGTDCPVLSPGHLQAAARALISHDACLIPAEDGGYVLIGLKHWIPEVFEQIDWSTDRVIAQTRERLKQAGASWHELPDLWDVDEAADWQRMQQLQSQATSSEMDNS
jgi:rSAM/selenodomain-associated transferase 2/rSAM/selenodomain-associated transferase 1